ncbi:hypothetical protein SLE2022_402950 [Rubroshorea leprosula]
MNPSNGKGSISMTIPSASWRTGAGVPDQFAGGLRVLVVDDDPTDLHLEEEVVLGFKKKNNGNGNPGPIWTGGAGYRPINMLASTH